jgi:hypothetical protein
MGKEGQKARLSAEGTCIWRMIVCLRSAGMRKCWTLASAIVVVNLVLLSACQAGQSPPGSATTTTPSIAPAATSTQGPTTTVSPSSTTATISEIIPGAASVGYENKQFGFSLYRPQNSAVETQGFGAYLPLTQAPVVAITLPMELFEGTNLIEAGVYIGASSSPAKVSKWNLPSAETAEVPAGTIEVNGTSFAVFTSTGAGAGNIYEERVYRALHDDTCLEIVELLHSGNIGNYEPGVVEFDRGKFQRYLEAIVQTFSFVSG